jgi:cardiolipin synthase C
VVAAREIEEVEMTRARVYHPLPSLDGRSVSTALADTHDTRIGRGVAPLVAAHPGTAGVYALPYAHDAFAARMLLARSAERSLDVQYYIWRGDLTGTLLLEALRSAADRGVRVRLLLDDNNTAGLDGRLAALDSHPCVEVRLFNPFPVRSPRTIGYLMDFSRLNRRMHNKSFTADNQVTIIGGRNVGDEYFDAGGGPLAFVDLDVLAIGPIVREVSSDFDRYWSSASAYPTASLLPESPPGALEELAAAALRLEHEPRAAAYMDTIRASAVIVELVAGTLQFEWAPARMVSDDPAKGLGQVPPERLLPEQLREIIGDPSSELDIVTPYFVPTASGAASLANLAQRGVRVRVLVNSLAATDVTAVHSGYVKHRKFLLESGITLYEMGLTAPAGVESRRAGPFGSSRSSLHAKTFAVDRERVFVGSFNFDPRSSNLNTELGFVIESGALARRMSALFDQAIPASAYQVCLSETGDVYWTESCEGKVVRHGVEPRTTVPRRVLVWFLSLLPIESLL